MSACHLLAQEITTLTSSSDVDRKEPAMEQICPRCKTSSYQKPNMKLMVNICGHRLCESCVDSVFTRPTASCPECGLALRRNQFRLQQFEDSFVEKEVDIRKRVLRDYNKCEEDFDTMREYNDYLEEVETIIYNLTNGIDVEETKQKTEWYRKENQAIIMKIRERQFRREKLLSQQLRGERDEQDLRHKRALEEEEEVTRARKRQKQSIIEDLIHSDRPAMEVLAAHAAASMEAEAASSVAVVKKDITGPTFEGQMGQTVFEPVPVEVGTVYSYQPTIVETYGPGVPDLEELESYGYLGNIRGLDEQHSGSGFVPAYACQRALQEAFSCLLFFPDR